MKKWIWKCPINNCNHVGRKWLSHAKAQQYGNRHMIKYHKLQSHNNIRAILVEKVVQ